MLHQILAKIVKQSVAYNFGCRALYNLPCWASVSIHQVKSNIPTLRPYCEKIYTTFLNDAEILTTYGCVCCSWLHRLELLRQAQRKRWQLGALTNRKATSSNRDPSATSLPSSLPWKFYHFYHPYFNSQFTSSTLTLWFKTIFNGGCSWEGLMAFLSGSLSGAICCSWLHGLEPLR